MMFLLLMSAAGTGLIYCLALLISTIFTLNVWIVFMVTACIVLLGLNLLTMMSTAQRIRNLEAMNSVSDTTEKLTSMLERIKELNR